MQQAGAMTAHPLATGYRWRLALVLGISLFIGYLDRLNISFAIPLMAQEFGWSSDEIQDYGGWLMSLFYVGYGIANIFLSPLASRFGPRKSLLCIVALWSLFTAMGAWASQWLMVFAASRVLLGLAEGPHFPMMAQLTKNWFPLNERSRANSLWISGLFLAMLAAPFIMVPMMETFGWRAGFYILAAAGLLITWPLIWIWVKDKPQQVANLHPDELAHIEAGATETTSDTPSLRWHQLLRNKSYLAILFAGMMNNVVALGIASWLPTFFTEKKGIPYEELTWLVPLPFVFSLIGLVFWSQIGDRLNRRAIVAATGFIGASVAIFIALEAQSLWLTVVGFSAATFCISAFPTAEFALVQKILPGDSIASGVGLYNGLSTMIGGGLGPVLVAPIIGDGSGTWIVSVVAIANGLLLLTLYRRLRY
ncbi:MFS transporter [Paraferrimonas sedimenticola]|uniref:MFS transporter n=1 Tax=Paraferrimonas sedimenticola TaxID=375674 RepID=A0AA37RYS2_9GAMM|nr:MFS transporter [Paraferrimonas sedimenticola]GLP97789.1 MFS transporter [Paraferrimonas sedimenticola]